MKKIIIKDKYFKNIACSVACIGFFDGVHKGHQKLIKKTLNEAKKLKVNSCVICFNPDPSDIIYKEKNKHLTSIKERLKIFEEYGIDQVIIFKFNEEFMKTTPLKFINDYLNRFNLKKLICGFDYHFGYMAQGDYNLLILKGYFETIVIDKYEIAKEKVSSTRIKKEFILGNFKLVNKLLGYDYYLILKVNKITKKGDKWLIEAILKDRHHVFPQDNDYGEKGRIIKQKLYFESKVKYLVNEEIKYYFV